MPAIRISDIDIESSVQVRARIDPDTVQDYADHILAKKPPLPPIVVFGPDSRGKYFLSEGWHRLRANQRAGRDSIDATIKEGGWKDALEHALGSNSAHGLRRSNADKRRTVELALKHWPNWNDQMLSSKCAVSDRFVWGVRKESTPPNGSDVLEPRVILRKDGTTMTLPPPPTRPPSAPQRDTERERNPIPPVRMPDPPPEPTDPDQIPEPEDGDLPKDAKGRPIPPDCVPMWDRRREILDILKSISEIRTLVKDAQDDRDPLYVGKEQGRTRVNFTSVIAHLDQVYADMKAALVTRVCPVCQGLGCKYCQGLGLISEYHLHSVPSEYRH